MILTLLSIDNKEFYFMTGSQKPETIARYIRKGKIFRGNVFSGIYGTSTIDEAHAVKNFKKNFKKHTGKKYPYEN